MNAKRCEEIFDLAVRQARSAGISDVEALIGWHQSALTRFANNAIHQNMAERSGYLSLRVQVDGRTARASTNRLDPESVRRTVEEAIAITRLQEADPDLPPLAEPSAVTPVVRYFPDTARLTPHDRAQAVAEAIGVVRSAGQTAAGIYASSDSFSAVLNSRGVHVSHAESMAQFSITAMARDSSGWAKSSACDHRELDPRALARSAAEKAAASGAPKEVPPGRYLVILEPAAVLDLAGQMISDFSATAVTDGRSFLAGRIGRKVFGDNISIRDNVYHPLQAGAPFDSEGVPRQKLSLVEHGVVRDLAYSRQAARLANRLPTGHGFPVPNEFGEAPMNPVIEGGDSSLAGMVAATGRGILVTRFWYIREVDPSEKVMTGMTRDGTFLVENGKIAYGLRNFRFNVSLLEMLSQVQRLGPATRASGEEAFDMVVPAMQVSGFPFTEVTRF